MDDFQFGKGKHRQNMGSRYIEVYESSVGDMEREMGTQGYGGDSYGGDDYGNQGKDALFLRKYRKFQQNIYMIFVAKICSYFSYIYVPLEFSVI